MHSDIAFSAPESASDPALAVITVTYSPGRHLGELLGSLDAATDRPTFTVCADNGSTDGVPQAAAAASRSVACLSTGGNIGYGAAINTAAAALRPRRENGEIARDYLLIVNPDVTFEPGSIDALIACLDAAPQAGAAGPKIAQSDGSIYPSAREVPGLATGAGHALLGTIWPGNPFSARYRAGEDMQRQRTAGWLSGSCLLVRWEAFDQLGGFDERYFMYLEDIDFGDRLTRAGWQNLYCPDAVIRHDQGHVAGKFTRVTVPAHHESAYRFQRDRHPHWWQAPVRLVLRAGLGVRSVLAQRRMGRAR